jgi:protein phosphatase
VVKCRPKEVHVPGPGRPAYTKGSSTRTGRPFFNDAALEASLLERVRHGAAASGLWDELNTDWLLLDCELMPWSLKARELIQEQYAPVGAAARTALAVEWRPSRIGRPWSWLRSLRSGVLSSQTSRPSARSTGDTSGT